MLPYMQKNSPRYYVEMMMMMMMIMMMMMMIVDNLLSHNSYMLCYHLFHKALYFKGHIAWMNNCRNTLKTRKYMQVYDQYIPIIHFYGCCCQGQTYKTRCQRQVQGLFHRTSAYHDFAILYFYDFKNKNHITMNSHPNTGYLQSLWRSHVLQIITNMDIQNIQIFRMKL